MGMCMQFLVVGQLEPFIKSLNIDGLITETFLWMCAAVVSGGATLTLY